MVLLITLGEEPKIAGVLSTSLTLQRWQRFSAVIWDSAESFPILARFLFDARSVLKALQLESVIETNARSESLMVIETNECTKPRNVCYVCGGRGSRAPAGQGRPAPAHLAPPPR